MARINQQPWIKLQFSHYVFAPKLLPTLLTIIMLPILIALGFWQLHRADVKRAMLHDYQVSQQSQPLQLAEINAEWTRYRYYPVKLAGHYDNAHNILLDNKMHEHRPGYQVLTPFIIANKGSEKPTMVLINRGWIAQGVSRQQLPMIENIAGTQTVIGRIDLPPKRSFVLANEDSAKISWPLVSQTISLSYYEKLLNHPLLPIVVLLNPDLPNGFIRQWQPVTISPYKNLGYALQWFALAAALAIIFIVVNTHRKKT